MREPAKSKTKLKARLALDSDSTTLNQTHTNTLIICMYTRIVQGRKRHRCQARKSSCSSEYPISRTNLTILPNSQLSSPKVKIKREKSRTTSISRSPPPISPTQQYRQTHTENKNESQTQYSVKRFRNLVLEIGVRTDGTTKTQSRSHRLRITENDNGF